ncbi:MAG: ATP-dependent DNA helicase RecG [Planctomyces sp.]|nr:ATP-dependent DNA helicase RecG [Planctomyces sp.]
MSDIPSIPDAGTDPLLTPVQYVPTVGPQRALLLGNLEIRTARDLLFHIPTGVNDFTDVREVPQLQPDVEQSVHGRVVDRDGRQLSGGRTLVAILLNCRGHFVRGLWFNQPWMLKRFRDDEHVVFSGKPQRKMGRWEFSNPKVYSLSDDDDIDAAAGVFPKYPLTEGINIEQMRRMTRSVVDQFADLVPDPLPEAFRERLDLPRLSTALQWLHCPDSAKHFEAARNRVLLDDLLEFQLGMALRRRVWNRSFKAFPIKVSQKVDARIRRLFDFRLTQGQDAAVNEIVSDLNGTQPMHRLLQADVGAGKTAVAVYAMLAAVAAGYQTVLMAPTEVLATQHWDTIDELLSESRVNRGLLIGGLPVARKKQLVDAISSGEAQLLVGTQALIQESVKFNRLALAIIDEQHRFGVRQRAGFSGYETQPHVLVMTATPIPRSLCLTRFGDLDVSTIRELPPGRQKVVTTRISVEAQQARMWDFVRRQIGVGRQAYVVCPRVEGQTEDDLNAVETVYQQLAHHELSGLRLGLLHGRMDRDERHRVMDQFRCEEINVLISTTVIEVGVNVPNATVMVIQQAERFGLAQLHQLRGRICRGSFQGYCFLLSTADSPEAIDRLAALEQSSDGFVIAEKDAELRGPGDVLGVRQSGSLPLRVANPVRDFVILQKARLIAQEMVQSGEFDLPEFRALKAIVLDRFAHVLDLPQTG